MISSFTDFLNTLPAEITLFLFFIAASFFLLIFVKFFGKLGLYIYGVLAIVLGNIQVLKGTHLTFWEEPVALGTILFSLTFSVSDILTECYGRRAAQRSVWLGFSSALMVTALMTLTIGIRPLVGEGSTHPFIQGHKAIEVLFKPSIAIFSASLIAYVVSQFLDIFLFQKLKDLWPEKALWSRSILSTGTSFLIDNILFSTLAWVLFAEIPVSMKTLIWTYILGTYALRLLMAAGSLPLVYLARRLLVKAPDDTL
tara:strand:- start:264 stop:1028 length:765 start_codon:yes stop_codon:yes gene_type:complete